MSTTDFEEFDEEAEDLESDQKVIIEASPSTKLERRRKIEDLFEEKRLKEELSEFA